MVQDDRGDREDAEITRHRSDRGRSILPLWSESRVSCRSAQPSYVMAPLTEDEFRLLAFMRGYADGPQQHLDPGWVQEHLGFSEARMRKAARALEARGLVEIF